MERRSRSTTRKQHHELSASLTNGHSLSRDMTRHASLASAGPGGRHFPENLVHRVGGDSRTLSPERKPHNYGFPKTSPHHSMNKSGSYNVYTHGQPPPIPPPHGLTHAASAIALGVNGTNSNPVPPPRAPINNQQQQNRNKAVRKKISKQDSIHFGLTNINHLLISAFTPVELTNTPILHSFCPRFCRVRLCQVRKLGTISNFLSYK